MLIILLFLIKVRIDFSNLHSKKIMCLNQPVLISLIIFAEVKVSIFLFEIKI